MHYKQIMRHITKKINLNEVTRNGKYQLKFENNNFASNRLGHRKIDRGRIIQDGRTIRGEKIRKTETRCKLECFYFNHDLFNHFSILFRRVPNDSGQKKN